MKHRSNVTVASGFAVLLGAWIAFGGFGQMAIRESTMRWILVPTLGFLTLAIGVAMRGGAGMKASRKVA